MKTQRSLCNKYDIQLAKGILHLYEKYGKNKPTQEKWKTEDDWQWY